MRRLQEEGLPGRGGVNLSICSALFRSLTRQTHEKNLTSPWTSISPQKWQLTLPLITPELWYTRLSPSLFSSLLFSYLRSHEQQSLPLFSFLTLFGSHTHARICVVGASLWSERGKRRLGREDTAGEMWAVSRWPLIETSVRARQAAQCSAVAFSGHLALLLSLPKIMQATSAFMKTWKWFLESCQAMRLIATVEMCFA